MTKESLVVTDYKSAQDYVFISYSSKDEDVVFNNYVIPLQEKEGMRVYYDKNFKDHATENWSDQMFDNITNAKLCLAFISKDYVCSYACLLEILTALVHGIPILKIQINQPEEYAGAYDERKMSDTTIKAYKDIAEILDDEDKLKSYRVGYKKVKKYFEDGVVPLNKLSKFSIEVLGQIANTRINDKDGLEHIMMSIKNAVKGNPFAEKPKIAEIPRAEENTNKEEIPVQEKTDKKKDYSATGDITYKLYGAEYTDNQSDMMLNVFAKVLKQHSDLLPAIIDMPGMNCLSKTDYTVKANQTPDMPSYFRVCEYFPIGNGVCVGTAYSWQDKVKKIATLLHHCDESKDVFEANDPAIRDLFDSYYQKLQSGVPKKGKASAETYSIYGRETSGTQSDMMVAAIKSMIEHHFDRLNELVNKLTSVQLGNIDTLRDITYFRAGESVTYNGVEYSIGTSYNRSSKLDQIRKAIEICDEDPNNFVIEGLFDSGDKTTGTKTGKKSKRDFLNE